MWDVCLQQQKNYLSSSQLINYQHYYVPAYQHQNEWSNKKSTGVKTQYVEILLTVIQKTQI
jgi:hypothetical protein